MLFVVEISIYADILLESCLGARSNVWQLLGLS
jgi:hypothetical protein